MFDVREDEIEDRIEEIKDLMRIWMRFYRILSSGFDSESLTPEKEQEFNQIKTVVAQRHRHFMEVIDNDDDKYIGQNILNLVKRVISLKEFGKLSSLEINKISIEWHDANILLNEILGSLEFQLIQAKKGLKTGVGKNVEESNPWFQNFLGSKNVKFGFAVAVIAAIAVVVFVFRAEIQSSSFYQTYLASYVSMLTEIFSSN